MGTDRSLIYETPCKCGQGRFVIEHCSPDHGWSGSDRVWYEAWIECSDCKTVYEIQKHGNEFVLVDKKALLEMEEYKKERRSKISVRCEDLMQSDEITEALSQLTQLLDSQRSVAATFRLLRDAKLTRHLTDGTFRNHWTYPDDWVKTNISINNIQKALKLLGLSIPLVKKEITEINHMIRLFKADITQKDKKIETHTIFTFSE